MPYILHPKHADTNYAAYAADHYNQSFNEYLFALYPDYENRKDAYAAMIDQGFQASHKITYIPTDDEYDTWRQRERARFKSGEYIHVPWQAHDRYDEHYAHLSLTKPGLIAYSKDAEHGVADRQTAVKPGKYLEEFYPGEFSKSQVAEWIGQCGAKHLELQITNDRADIRTVYIKGPNSCMKAHFDNLPCHPAEVYAGPDLALAYYGDKSDASARAVVWPAKQIYSRVYGNESVMIALLRQAGYTKGSLEGARVLKIACDRGFVMPYVDYVENCKIGKQFITLTDSEGDYSCQNTDGYTRYRNSDDDCDDDPEPELVTCDHCYRDYDPEDDDAGEFCPSCMEDRYTCEHCGSGVWSDDVVTIGHSHYCDDCAHSEHDRTCAHPACDNTWIEEIAFSDERQGERLIAGVSAFCEDCVERGECYVCHVCAGINENNIDRCVHCLAPPRCTQTADLFTVCSDQIMESIAHIDAQTVDVRFYYHGRNEACHAEYGNVSVNFKYGCCLPTGHTGRHMCPGELERTLHMDLAPYADRVGYVIPVPVRLLEEELV